MKQLKTALIGLGRIGWGFHLPNIIEHEGFDLCAVVDTSLIRLEEAHETYHVDVFLDIGEMLAAKKPDLVVIASPTHLHKEHAISAMQAGADVFLDKPIAVDYEEAVAIHQVAGALGRKIMVYQPHRAVPELGVLQRIIASGVLGDIYMIKRAVSSYSRRNDWQTLKQFGGGMLNNYGAHYIDQMLYFTNSHTKREFCRCHTIATAGDAEDVVKIVLGLESGCTVDIDINCATAYPLPAWMIFGKYGTAIYEGDGWEKGIFHLKYYDSQDVETRELDDTLAASQRAYCTDAPIPWRSVDYPIYQENKVNFYEKCYEYYAGNEEPFVPIAQTLEVMRIIRDLHRISQ